MINVIKDTYCRDVDFLTSDGIFEEEQPINVDHRHNCTLLKRHRVIRPRFNRKHYSQRKFLPTLTVSCHTFTNQFDHRLSFQNIPSDV